MNDQSPVLYASAHITGGKEAPKLRGNALFSQKQGYVLAEFHVVGLPSDNPSGFFALHIHEGGSCGGESFSETGSHYNPGNALHPNHAGDLPSLLYCGGEAWLAVETDRFEVRDIIGKTVVIHSGPDDFHTQPAGNAGTKIACGIIR